MCAMAHRSLRLYLYVLLVSLCIPLTQANPLTDIPASPAKLVFLTIEADKYIVSDIRSNRFVELRRQAKERLIDSAEAKQIIIIASNQRFSAYSALTQSWSSIRSQAGEKLEAIRAEDYAALITTNQRLLSYSGASGVWIQKNR